MRGKKNIRTACDKETRRAAGLQCVALPGCRFKFCHLEPGLLPDLPPLSSSNCFQSNFLFIPPPHSFSIFTPWCHFSIVFFPFPWKLGSPIRNPGRINIHYIFHSDSVIKDCIQPTSSGFMERSAVPPPQGHCAPE